MIQQDQKKGDLVKMNRLILFLFIGLQPLSTIGAFVNLASNPRHIGAGTAFLILALLLFVFIYFLYKEYFAGVPAGKWSVPYSTMFRIHAQISVEGKWLIVVTDKKNRVFVIKALESFPEGVTHIVRSSATLKGERMVEVKSKVEGSIPSLIWKPNQDVYVELSAD